MKYVFIINSIAGRGKYKKLLPKIENACKKRKLNYEIRYITNELTGAKIAEEYKGEENYIYVVSSKTEDTRPIVKNLNAAFEGKGGGKPNYAQGKIISDSEEKIKAFAEGI